MKDKQKLNETLLNMAQENAGGEENAVIEKVKNAVIIFFVLFIL